MDELTFSLFNFRAGGLREDGAHDFAGLARAFLDDPDPDVIVLCEAKEWHRDGQKPFLTALHELSLLHGRPYVGQLHEGPLTTAIIYDPTKLCLIRGEDPTLPDRRARARFVARADGQHEFEVRAEHWCYASGISRFARAQRLAQYGVSERPTVIAGDLNESASGPDFPEHDWAIVPTATRDYAAVCDEGDNWTRRTEAVDRLIGVYEPNSAGRLDGSGFHSVAELDPGARRPFPATSNVRNLHVDHILVNDAMLAAAGVVPGSYKVHIPAGIPPDQWPSDHRRVSCTLRFHTDALARGAGGGHA